MCVCVYVDKCSKNVWITCLDDGESLGRGSGFRFIYVFWVEFVSKRGKRLGRLEILPDFGEKS